MPESLTTAGVVVNAAGREVPEIVNGTPRLPYRGVGVHRPDGRRHGPTVATCADYPTDGDKRTGAVMLPASHSGTITRVDLRAPSRARRPR